MAQLKIISLVILVICLYRFSNFILKNNLFLLVCCLVPVAMFFLYHSSLDYSWILFPLTVLGSIILHTPLTIVYSVFYAIILFIALKLVYKYFTKINFEDKRAISYPPQSTEPTETPAILQCLPDSLLTTVRGLVIFGWILFFISLIIYIGSAGSFNSSLFGKHIPLTLFLWFVWLISVGIFIRSKIAEIKKIQELLFVMIFIPFVVFFIFVA